MTPKPPRRTAERILLVTLDLFNRFGEPNVSTTLISAELNISPGNLYYHYRSKDELIDALAARYEQALAPVLAQAPAVEDEAGARRFVAALLQQVWAHRFLYRDLNDLLGRSRGLEQRVQALVQRQQCALRTLLDRLADAGVLALPQARREPLAEAMLVLLSHWLSHAYVLQPRQALEPAHAADTLERGTDQVMGLLEPWQAMLPGGPATLAHLSQPSTPR
ncbi:TetR/AcrR family transcriptional regulator [Aquabacterium sp. J223]|uniref:TetR/AcrR family transcriptional regulator n=1 Tax=Aquabacterium sp. J223 TaxID=2898431 RepID=UPI0021AE1C4A|nr:TetR/AcrR family transcriptional regulator [Aquabacterium sp. J223]UUX96562.1 TetR/AcrR family transcriptional regulator [Aquabacterium sp. J223]